MEFSAYDIGLVPVIVTLVLLIRNLGFPARFLPLFAIALGEAGAFVYVAPNEPKQAVLVGLVMGFSAIGLWSGTKNTIERRED